ncbi:MAG: peptide chain release factor N(5)-glutamine methyltransferase [Chlorobaculum sp.]
MPEEKVWSVVELLRTTIAFFAEKKIDEPRLSAELLLGHVLGLQRLQLYLDHERPLTLKELEAFRAACRERLQGRPVQYIAGEAFFYGYRFFVDERVLIPRPETELVLEHAMERLAASGLDSADSPSILDVGTGSGCIAITLALRLPGARVTAADVSADALDVARRNADAHGVADRVRFVEADALSASFADAVGGQFDLLVSNPPYIPEAEWATLQEEVRQYEPRLALVAPSGFEYYQSIAVAAPSLLRKGGVLCFELHADGAAEVRNLLVSSFADVQVMQDYNKLDRGLSCIAQ